MLNKYVCEIFQIMIFHSKTLLQALQLRVLHPYFRVFEYGKGASMPFMGPKVKNTFGRYSGLSLIMLLRKDK
jgi:hypothetical protein